MEARAIFGFTILTKPNPQVCIDLIGATVKLASVQDSPFCKFYVHLEEAAEFKHLPRELAVNDLAGTIAQVSLAQVHTWAEKKLDDEESARKKPGHTSFQPPRFMETETFILAIGSRAFCSSIACIHMEELDTLRPKLIRILDGINNLHPYRKGTPRLSGAKEDSLLAAVAEDPKAYLRYNINWLIAREQGPIISDNPMELIARRMEDLR